MSLWRSIEKGFVRQQKKKKKKKKKKRTVAFVQHNEKSTKIQKEHRQWVVRSTLRDVQLIFSYQNSRTPQAHGDRQRLVRFVGADERSHIYEIKHQNQY
jgi:hypothetical protein